MSKTFSSNTLKKEQQTNGDNFDQHTQLNYLDHLSNSASNSNQETSSSKSTIKKQHIFKCKLFSQQSHHHHHYHHHHLKNHNLLLNTSNQLNKRKLIEEKKIMDESKLTPKQQILNNEQKTLQHQLQMLVNSVDTNVNKLVDQENLGQQFSPTLNKNETGHFNFGYQNSPITSIFNTTQSNVNKSTNASGTGVTHTLTLSKSHNYSNHCHTDSNDTGIDKTARRKLIIASLLCLIFMIGEIIGGILSSSLAIATDAAHLLTDFASFMISLFSIWMASRPATKKMSFGYYRAEVIGALTSVVLIWVVTGILVLIAAQRLINEQYEIDAPIMLITASVGVVVNIIMGISLQIGGVPHGHHHHSHHHEHSNEELGTSSDSHSSMHKNSENLNVRAAFIHVLGDFIQSLGVMMAAIVIYFYPHLQWIDPVCTFIFSILVLITTFHIIRDVVNVLMEGIPKGIDFLEVQKTLFNIPGVIKVHNLRVWSLSLDKIALSAHLAIGKNQDPKYVLRKASKLIKEKFNIFDLTIQVEEYKDEMQDCSQCNPNFVNENSVLLKK